MDPTTVWLREEYGNRAFFPNSANTSFDLPEYTAFVLQVMGTSLEQQHSRPGTPLAHIPAMEGPSGVSSRPQFTSAFSKKSQSCTVKVIQASLKRLPNGKCEFSHMGQLFVDVNESTANANYIRSVVQTKWGSQYVIVTTDGLEIEDSSGTQGRTVKSKLCIYWLWIYHRT